MHAVFGICMLLFACALMHAIPACKKRDLCVAEHHITSMMFTAGFGERGLQDFQHLFAVSGA
jgi:hypothetical protein